MRLVPARLTHTGFLAHRLREHDRRECEAFGRSPKQALRISLATSLEAWTALVDGVPEAMFGVSPIDVLQGKGSPWFLGSDRVFSHARDLLFYGPLFIDRWQETFPLMENAVSCENEKAIRLLRRWGAIIGTEPRMIGGVEFVPFSFGDVVFDKPNRLSA